MTTIHYLDGLWSFNDPREHKNFGWAACGYDISLHKTAVTMNTKLVTCKNCLKVLKGWKKR